ncbi:hypothetical protein [Streptomyces sp. NPDC058623]|uniref:hypothetical protein n=1 Tax=Streptomyces sp. NPDC058623 TaxID=3346563 RepID=UPI00365FE38F
MSRGPAAARWGSRPTSPVVKTTTNRCRVSLQPLYRVHAWSTIVPSGRWLDIPDSETTQWYAGYSAAQAYQRRQRSAKSVRHHPHVGARRAVVQPHRLNSHV